MTYKTLLIIATLTFSVKSCVFSGCEKLDFMQKDLKWLNSYKKGQLLYFKNQFGDIDTMIVSEHEVRYSSCNKIALSEFQHQELAIRIDNLHENNLLSKTRIQVEFDQDEKGMLSSKCFYIFDYSFWGGRDLDKEIEDTLLHLNYFKKKEIHCLAFTPYHDRSHDGSNDKLDTFFWSHDFGLVKYIIFDSVQYELIKN